MGLGLNLQVNGRDYPAPMVVEEPSVIAAVSNMSRLVRRSGGFTAEADQAAVVGQLLVTGLARPQEAEQVRGLERLDIP